MQCSKQKLTSIEKKLPVEVVGDFCGFLLEEMQYRQPNAIIPKIIEQLKPEFKLLSPVNISNIDLMHLIYFVFEGFPSSKQLLRCDRHTTLEELDIFFERITFFPKNRYLILGVNTLTHELQQVIIQK